MKILEMPTKMPAQEAETYCCKCWAKLLIEESDIFYKTVKEKYEWTGSKFQSKIPYFKCMNCGEEQPARGLKWCIKKEEAED